MREKEREREKKDTASDWRPGINTHIYLSEPCRLSFDSNLWLSNILGKNLASAKMSNNDVTRGKHTYRTVSEEMKDEEMPSSSGGMGGTYLFLLFTCRQRRIGTLYNTNTESAWHDLLILVIKAVWRFLFLKSYGCVYVPFCSFICFTAKWVLSLSKSRSCFWTRATVYSRAAFHENARRRMRICHQLVFGGGVLYLVACTLCICVYLCHQEFTRRRKKTKESKKQLFSIQSLPIRIHILEGLLLGDEERVTNPATGCKCGERQ